MAQTPSNVGAKSWPPEFSNAWRPYMSNSFSHPQKKVFSQVYKSVGLHLWKTCNYGNFKARFVCESVQTLGRSLCMYHCLVIT